MCQYSSGADGVPTIWHATHYASRAVGGAGMVVVESTAVAAKHRTTDHDLGLYADDQVLGHRAITDGIHAGGALAAVQLQCAGRKSSHQVPWVEKGQRTPQAVSSGGWIPEAPSALPFGDLHTPSPLDESRMEQLLEDFVKATRRADKAGYDAVEIHAANGYLLHQFLSPLSNLRTDRYGGSLENRMRFPLSVIEAVRSAWPEPKPLMVRITATDWTDGGITVQEAVAFAAELSKRGVDVVDVSSGALDVDTPRHFKPLYNALLAPRIREATSCIVAVSGLIGSVEQLNVVVPDLADVAVVGRPFLRDPYWALRHLYNEPSKNWPPQYRRAF